MPEKHSLAVSVIGTGRMSSVLATGLFNAGFPTTVWNRTVAKTEPLARLELRVAQSLEAAMAADVVIVNLSDYHTTGELVKDPEVASALAGKTIVQLTTGTPQEAGQMESWARQTRHTTLTAPSRPIRAKSVLPNPLFSIRAPRRYSNGSNQPYCLSQIRCSLDPKWGTHRRLISPIIASQPVRCSVSFKVTSYAKAKVFLQKSSPER